MKENYFAMIGDIVDSRHLSDRSAVQVRLETLLKKINSSFSSAIKASFLITIGDEFQGLLLPSSQALIIANMIIEEMHPVKIRFGLGYGHITTAIKDSALGMDGPAFYAARQAMDFLKRTKESGLRLSGSSLDQTLLSAVNALMSSLSVIRQFWPDNFKTALPLVRKELTQQEIADATNVSQSAVSWMLHRAKWRQVAAIEKDLMSLLDLILNAKN